MFDFQTELPEASRKCPHVENKFHQQQRHEITIIMFKKVFLLNTGKSVLSSETKFSMSAVTCVKCLMKCLMNELFYSPKNLVSPKEPKHNLKYWGECLESILRLRTFIGCRSNKRLHRHVVKGSFWTTCCCFSLQCERCDSSLLNLNTQLSKDGCLWHSYHNLFFLPKLNRIILLWKLKRELFHYYR